MADESNYPSHERSYERFLGMTKWTIILTAIVTVAVVLIIAN